MPKLGRPRRRIRTSRDLLTMQNQEIDKLHHGQTNHGLCETVPLISIGLWHRVVDEAIVWFQFRN